MLEGAVNKYNKCVIEISKVIEELLSLAKKMDATYKNREHTGFI